MPKDFMKTAVRHPGALTATAKKHGAVKKGGGIKSSFLDKAASGAYGETTKKRAVLAKTFNKYRPD